MLSRPGGSRCSGRVRRDNWCGIPDTVRRYSEEDAWVTQPTRLRKETGQQSLLGKRERKRRH